MARRPDAVVISLGGSLIAPPGGVDAPFLRRFRALILAEVRKGRRFVIVCGGGATARAYQGAARRTARLTRDDLDWLGIHATRLNAHLVRTILRSVAHPRLITDPREPVPKSSPVVVAAGWKPGWSTDYDAVLLAKGSGASRIVNLSNVAYVYDKDPKEHPGARRFERMGWREFRALFGSRWDPGLSAPFDPVAARAAERAGITVVIADGKDIGNARDILRDRRFRGTVVGGA